MKNMMKNKGMIIGIIGAIAIAVYFWMKKDKEENGAKPKKDKEENGNGAYDPYETGKMTEGAINEWGKEHQDNVDYSVIPVDFDWVVYVKSNKDLQDAGIDTEAEARFHFAHTGISQSRKYKL